MIRQYLIVACLFALPAWAQSVSIQSEGENAIANVAVDWATLEREISGGLAAPILTDPCGTEAHVVGTSLNPPGSGTDGSVTVTVALSRVQCVEIQEMVCKGFACKPQVRSSRTKLYGQKIDLSFDLQPDIVAGSGLTISAAPALDPARMKDLVARVPDFRRVDGVLRDRITAALEPTANAIILNLPQNFDAGSVGGGTLRLDTEGLKFDIQQMQRPSQ